MSEEVLPVETKMEWSRPLMCWWIEAAPVKYRNTQTRPDAEVKAF
jgi:hypothetical protein